MARAVWLLAGLVGCGPYILPNGDGDGDEDGIEVQSWRASCPAVDRWSATAEVRGPTTGVAVLDIIETGVVNGWNETHRMVVVSSVPITTTTGTGGTGATTVPTGPAPVLETFDLELERALSPFEVDDPGDGTGHTLWGCGTADSFNLGTLTFALRVYGLDRALGDCVAFGQDPQVILDGTYSTTNGQPPDATELSSCRIATF
jgi:hypothetical protein